MAADGYSAYEVLAGHKSAFTLHARNTVTGERRDVTVYAKDAMAAGALGFALLDAEAGDRSWCFDAFTKDHWVTYGEVR